MQKQYEMHNHLDAVLGHAACEPMYVMFSGNPRDAGTGNPDCMRCDFTFLSLESPAPAAAYSVLWLESVIFLSTFCQLFEMNVSELTSNAGLQKN